MKEQDLKQLLKDYRITKGIKPNHVFKATGITGTQLTNWEDTDVSFTMPTLLNLLDFYGMEMTVTLKSTDNL